MTRWRRYAASAALKIPLTKVQASRIIFPQIDDYRATKCFVCGRPGGTLVRIGDEYQHQGGCYGKKHKANR